MVTTAVPVSLRHSGCTFVGPSCPTSGPCGRRGWRRVPLCCLWSRTVLVMQAARPSTCARAWRSRHAIGGFRDSSTRWVHAMVCRRVGGGGPGHDAAHRSHLHLRPCATAVPSRAGAGLEAKAGGGWGGRHVLSARPRPWLAQQVRAVLQAQRRRAVRAAESQDVCWQARPGALGRRTKWLALPHVHTLGHTPDVPVLALSRWACSAACERELWRAKRICASVQPTA